jgi:hypothetical protein
VPGLRFVYLLGLVVWLGGVLVLGSVVAPALFESLSARVPSDGRVLAGAAFGAVLARFHVAAYACGVLMTLTLVLMALLGPRPRPFAPRLAVIVLMLGITTAIAFPIGQRLDALQGAVPGEMATLPEDDARKIAFARLHRTASGLLAVNVFAGLMLLFWEVRERRW